MTRHLFDAITPARFDVRQAAASSRAIATLAGYALTWNTLSSDRGGYVVRLAPGSASFAPQTLALFGHDYNRVIGSTAARTLRLRSDSRGVAVEIDLPDTSDGRDVLALVRRGDVAGMSFGMTAGPTGTTRTEGGLTILDVPAFTLDEVTITAIPAFASTSIGVLRDAPTAAYESKPATVSRFDRVNLARARLAACRLLPG